MTVCNVTILGKTPLPTSFTSKLALLSSNYNDVMVTHYLVTSQLVNPKISTQFATNFLPLFLSNSQKILPMVLCYAYNIANIVATFSLNAFTFFYLSSLLLSVTSLFFNPKVSFNV